MGESADVVVDYVQWLDFRIPILHLYTRKDKSMVCRSFIPLEDTQPPVHINLSNRLRRLVTAAGVDDAEYLEVGGHALLDTRRSTVKRWLGHSEADIRSAGKQFSTLVSAHVFRQLAGRSKSVQATGWWAAHKDTDFHTADELMVAAGHEPNPPLFFGMVR
jgi:hypothetical protein